MRDCMFCIILTSGRDLWCFPNCDSMDLMTSAILFSTTSIVWNLHSVPQNEILHYFVTAWRSQDCIVAGKWDKQDEQKYTMLQATVLIMLHCSALSPQQALCCLHSHQTHSITSSLARFEQIVHSSSWLVGCPRLVCLVIQTFHDICTEVGPNKGALSKNTSTEDKLTRYRYLRVHMIIPHSNKAFQVYSSKKYLRLHDFILCNLHIIIYGCETILLPSHSGTFSLCKGYMSPLMARWV